jgi:hypothetical protein
MSNRDILDEPWQMLVGFAALIAAVALPDRHQHWPVVAVSAAIAAIGFLSQWRKRRASCSWALASGTVESSSAAGDPHGFGWIVEIAYSYQAHDGWHSGFGSRRFLRGSAAETAAAQLRGASVAVRYNPKAPDESVLANS